MTAADLLNALRDAGCEPGVDGTDLVFASDPPARLAQHLAVLHTGVRALLTGWRWFALDPAGRSCGPHRSRGDGRLAFGALDPAEPIPHPVTLVIVEGDPCWDRIDPRAKLDMPDVFTHPPEPKRLGVRPR